MVTIQQTIPGDLAPAYNPIFFEVRQNISNTQLPTPVIEVTVNVNGEDFAVIPYPPQFVTTGLINSATFFIDVQEVLQDWFNNRVNLLEIGSGDTFTDAENIAEFFLKIRSFIPSEDGILIPEIEEVQTQTKYSINARPTHRENQSLEDFTAGFPRRFLTDKPRPVTVCSEDSEALYFYREFSGLLRWRIKAYNADGGVVGQGFIPVGEENRQIHGLGIGPENINNISGWSNGGVTITPDVSFYEVSVVASFSDNSGDYLLNYTEVVRFNVVGCCPSYRFHFLNKYGVFDAVSVRGDISESYSVKSADLEKTMPLFIDTGFSTGRTSNRLSATNNRQVNISAYGIRKDSALWLRQLSETVECFIEDRDSYFPVILKDRSNDIYNTGEPFVEFNITAEFNREVSQRS